MGLKNTITVLTGASFVISVSTLQAQTITPGFTFAVASAPNSHATGNHFHSNTGGAFGNPAGKAEVGAYSAEEVRGLSEYNLAGLSAGTAFVNLKVYKVGGLFSGVNNFPKNGTIEVFAYQGNNLEDISDYQHATFASLGTFNTTGLALGDSVSLDATSAFDTALANGYSSLGIRLQFVTPVLTGDGAYTFENITLTSKPTGTVGTVPEPGVVSLLLCTGISGAAMLTRRRRN